MSPWLDLKISKTGEMHLCVGGGAGGVSERINMWEGEQVGGGRYSLLAGVGGREGNTFQIATQ